MKKITKILLPIASTVAVAAPMVCMTSCASAHYKNKIETHIESDIEAGGISETFEAKKEISDDVDHIDINLRGFTLPKGIVTTKTFLVTLNASREYVSIIIVGLKDEDTTKDLASGATISVTAEIIAKDSNNEPVWTESSSVFKIVHNPNVN